MNKVIVIGCDHHNTLGVIRSLGYKGIKSILILVTSTNRTYISHSKYIMECHKVYNDEEAIAYLLKNKEKLKNSIVISCSDGSSSALDLNREKLVDFYKIPGACQQGELTKFMDKELMSEFGRSVGFNVPNSKVVGNINDISDVVYPCITKPILSKDGQKSDIEICYKKEELVKVIKKGSCYRYQVQDFIEKDFEYQLIGLSIGGGDDVVIPGISKCLRPCPRTNTGFLQYLPLNSYNIPLEECRQFIKKIGYSGLFSMEFLRSKKGEDYFLEINFRNDGNAICVTASGINLPYIWYLANTNGDYKKEIELSTFHTVYVMPEFADFKNFVLNGKITLFKWVSDIRKTNKFMEFDKKDPLPFFYYFINRILKK